MRPSLARNLEGRTVEHKIVDDDRPRDSPPKKRKKAEPVRKKLPGPMQQKLRDEHKNGATVSELMRRWGLLHDEVTGAIGGGND